MNGALLEAFRHNAWATRHLLVFCRDLPPEQLATGAPGTYGTILATFNHVIGSDASYVHRLAGPAPSWVDDDGTDPSDLEVLLARADEAARLWEEYLQRPDNAERVMVVDDGAYEVRAGIFVAQALHHGNAHREQICAGLTGLGIEPPDVQPWEYAWATRRIWARSGQ